MSYPHQSSSAGGAYMAPNPAVIHSQNTPHVPSQSQNMPGVPIQQHSQRPYPQSNTLLQHQHSFQRPIASLPSRHILAPQIPSNRPQFNAGRPQIASSMLQQRGSSTTLPRMTGDLSFRRVKLVGDGYEAPYLLPGPSNRILLSLKSGLSNQIDWALSRLVLLTHNHRDQAARDFTLDSVPGLADALLSFVHRLHAALTAQPATAWAASYFEQSAHAPDVGIGAPGDAGHQGTSSSQLVSSTAPSTALIKRITSSFAPDAAFNPSIDISHAALVRRALEAALALRNLSTHSSNARNMASIKGIFALIRDILRLPVTAIQTSSRTPSQDQVAPDHESGWLEIEGITELRLYVLDILDALASKVILTRRAASTAAISTALSLIDGQDSEKAPKEDVSSPGDDIFASLLSLALHSNDRAFLLGSLRCLSTMAALERNEAAFVEVTLQNGEQSPGLLQRCVELLPLTQDTELLEAVLDLLYQIVCIGNNAIKIATVLNTQRHRSQVSPSQQCSSTGFSSANANGVAATAKTAALIRLLTRNLQLGRIMWERLMPLKVPQDWLNNVPNRFNEAMRKRRELQIRIANETPQGRAKRKKLTSRERKSLLGLNEPDRGIAWMRMVFQRDPDSEVTQMEFWTAYKEEFSLQTDGVPLQPAAELIRAVGHVFPQAAAMVVPKQDGNPQRFVIRGISIKERDIDLLEPYRCHWATCPSAETDSLKAQRTHAKLHVQFASDGRCQWRRCNFDAKSYCMASTAEQKEVLMTHVLTHIKSDGTTTILANSIKCPKIVVDDDLRVVSGAEHTGEAANLLTAKTTGGGRVLRGKRGADGVEVAFNMDTRANGAVNGRVAPFNAISSLGTVDNPGSYVFDVTRTPSTGNDENLSPQGPAFTSILILRMLTRRAASLLQKAGSKQTKQAEDEEDAAAIRGQGDDKFGLPLPANFGSSNRAFKHAEVIDGDAASMEASGLSLWGGEEEDYETTEKWAVDAATRLLDSVQGVEEELMHHSSQNDILSSYINDTLMELRRRPSSVEGPVNVQMDPQLL
ncbi:uncharacterized protein MEPE_06056 [Melanopsichium pennsylvanicum]|uniref:RFX-type winged-helix domain-containing protein n=2 Tax=Melanopsichium pennsylvanicum TaxID=63383 RepID=A0AAJ5C7W4_9BASI|nr:uncharacterized protein BN887_02603 [Melanopsichium pennsylvanicum 4]SNX87346.1 uncharacterized protein MEPE_06056 [Melanopsichium pennsylvanicum]